MSNSNFAKDAKSVQPGQHVYFNHDGKTSGWATVTKVNEDGTLNLNAHAREGHIIGGFTGCKLAAGMDHSKSETWWV